MAKKSSGTKTAKPARKLLRAAKPQTQAEDLAVGARLRAVREEAGLSQRELAKRAGVTGSTISLIEQESHAPSLSSLHAILSAIPITMAEFFSLPTSKANVLLYDNEDLTTVTRGAAELGVLGSERRDKKLQLFFERYGPGASTGKELITHDGETAAVIVQGTMDLEVDGKVRRFEAGGGFHLFGKQPYRLTNVGRTIAIVVCACTPPMI